MSVVFFPIPGKGPDPRLTPWGFYISGDYYGTLYSDCPELLPAIASYFEKAPHDLLFL
jgi:hypothetical protein